MEILKESNAFLTWVFVIGGIIGLALLIWGAYWAFEENYKEKLGYFFMVFGTIIAFGGLIIGKIGSSSWKVYTVEINDRYAYQYLIENNYSINDRPYDSKNIYVITGKPLPTEWETDW